MPSFSSHASAVGTALSPRSLGYSVRLVAMSVLFLGLSVVASAQVSAQAPSTARVDWSDNDASTLTVEWIYSEEGRALAAMPSHRWLGGDRLLIREPGSSEGRAFEVLEPETGERTPLFDLERAESAVRSSFGSEAPDTLEWPTAMSESGRELVWSIEGDLFVADLSLADLSLADPPAASPGSRVFRRLTATAAEETSVNLSPDGRKVAYVRDHDLWVYDLDRRLERQLTSTGSETLLNGTLSWVYWEEIFARRDIGYWWSPDSSAIAFLETDESQVSISRFLDFEPKSVEVIEQRYPKTGEVNPSVRVGIVELETGEVTWADLDPKRFEYLARAQWLPDAGSLAVQTLSRDQKRLDLHRVERSSGESAHLMTESDDGWVNLNDDLTFLDDDGMLWVSERSSYAHLYRLDEDGNDARPLTRGDWALASSGGGVSWLRRAISHVDEEAGVVYFTAMKDSSIERHLYRISLDPDADSAEGGAIEKLTTEAGTHRIAFSPSGRFYVDQHSASGLPPRLALHRNDGSRVAVLAERPLDRVRALALELPELFEIPAGDGFRMPAEATRPPEFDPSRPYPVILHVYGGPSAPTVADAWSSDVLFDNLLTRAGFVVIRVDNRSATAISKTLENQILYQGYGTSELSDLVDATSWLGRQSWVDAERIGVWGWSGGGTFTLLAMTGSDRFKAGISVAAVTDWKYYDTRWAEAYMKLPSSNREGYEQTSLPSRAAELSGRLLLVHGTWDDNVHPQNAWAFADALIEHNVPFDMMMYPRRKHGIRDDAARRHLFNKMLEFWREHL